MKPLLTELWPQFCADADFVAGYAGALVERVEADRKKRIINTNWGKNWSKLTIILRYIRILILIIKLP